MEKFDLGGAAESQADHIAAFLKNNLIDIIVIEEAETADEPILTDELNKISYPMAYHSLSSMSDGYNAIGVWSRLPIISTAEILENTRTIYRIEIGIDDVQHIWFYGCHLKAGSEDANLSKRLIQAAALEEYIKQNHDPPTESIVILGDMNTASSGDWAVKGTISLLTLKSDNPDNTTNDFCAVNYTYLPDQWTDSYGSVLDHIILSPAAMGHYVDGSIEIAQPEGDGPSGPSDHYPVLLKLNY